MSRICTGLDDEMAVFRTRPLGHVQIPYVFVDEAFNDIADCRSSLATRTVTSTSFFG